MDEILEYQWQVVTTDGSVEFSKIKVLIKDNDYQDLNQKVVITKISTKGSNY